MYKVLTNKQMREADSFTVENCNISSETLMRRAGLAIAEEAAYAAEKNKTDEILIVCGTGNNGGDGYVCAQELLNRGYKVSVYAFDGSLSLDCRREKLAYQGGYLRHICGPIIVDCIFGTGLCREISGEFAKVINEINSSGAYVISADIPSGLNGDNGMICGVSVKADLTVAIAEFKRGLFLNDGLDVCGTIVKKDIGITVPEDGKYALIAQDEDVKKFFPNRKRNSHKGTYGSANIVAGSDKYIGAAALAVNAALQSGCGYVKLCTGEKVKICLAQKFPQVIFSGEPDLSSEAIAVGSGCGVSKELYTLIERIMLTYGGTLILDADGLNALAKYGVEILKNKKCKVIITPHVKEFSRLTGKTVDEIVLRSIELAEEFSLKYGVITLLKNAVSVITDGIKTVLNIRGSSALAKGGSGDMLTGFLCGTAARGLSAFDAAVCAAYTLGATAETVSAEKSDYCAVAGDIIKNLHKTVKRLTV